MKPKKDLHEGKGAIELIEEATQVLRLLPVDIYALYYIGSLPFVLAFLYFWTDMSRGAMANDYTAQAAFSLTAVYIWMKCWQAAFCTRIKARLLGDAAPKWTWRRALRIIAVQTALQPLSFIVLPVTSVILLPHAWMVAFFHNVSVCGNGKTSDIKEVYKEAWHQATLFTAQNHIFILIYSICGLFVFLNLATIIYLFPKLLSIFLGIETAFSRATWGMLNTTLVMATIGLSYLVLNPLAKTVYVLRCFYGESLQTGADLKVELTKYAASAKTIAAVILVLGTIGFGQPAENACGAENKPPAMNSRVDGAAAVKAPELDASIGEVIGKREYTWRMPREINVKTNDNGIVRQFISGMISTIKDWLKPIIKWLKSAIEWIVEKLSGWMKPSSAENTARESWKSLLRWSVYALIVLAALVLVFVLWRISRTYRRNRTAASAPVVAAGPDVTREDTLADELPADRWLQMAESLMAQGDLRSALRALYLAGLSQLARHNAIIIARFKSNREYERELYRKAHHEPDLLAAFSGNMRVYEGTWYGMHTISDDTVRTFKENQTRIMTIANKL